MNAVIEKNDAMQRKMALKSFLESAGFKIFKEELDNFVQYANECVEQQKSEGAIPLDGLSKLNYNFGCTRGLKMVLNVLDQYREELED